MAARFWKMASRLKLKAKCLQYGTPTRNPRKGQKLVAAGTSESEGIS